MNDIYLSLGSNIEPKIDHLKNAINLLNEKFKLIKLSSVYLTEPIDDIDQDDFYNMCAIYSTELSDPYQLLSILKNVEEEVGRVKDIKRPKGPRVIDIDLIFFNNMTIENGHLHIPHKAMLERKFVLEPLLQILPKDSIYITKYKLYEHYQSVMDQRVSKIGDIVIG